MTDTTNEPRFNDDASTGPDPVEASDRSDYGIKWEEGDALPLAAPRKKKRLTGSMAKKSKAQRETGFKFTLQYTLDEDGNQTEAIVRIVSVFDPEMLGAMPKALSAKIIQINQERARRQAAQQGNPQGQEQVNTATVLRELGRTKEMATAYCVAGFIDPKVYMTREAAEAQGGVFVDDIAYEDRAIFMAICEQGVGAIGNDVLSPFSGESSVALEGLEVSDPLAGEDAESDSPDTDEAPMPRLVAVDN